MDSVLTIIEINYMLVPTEYNLTYFSIYFDPTTKKQGYVFGVYAWIQFTMN